MISVQVSPDPTLHGIGEYAKHTEEKHDLDAHLPALLQLRFGSDSTSFVPSGKAAELKNHR